MIVGSRSGCSGCLSREYVRVSPVPDTSDCAGERLTRDVDFLHQITYISLSFLLRAGWAVLRMPLPSPHLDLFSTPLLGHSTTKREEYPWLRKN